MSNNERLTLTVEEAARQLGLSRGAAYQAVQRGEIPSLKFGKRIVIPVSALNRMLSEARANSTKDGKV